MPCSVHMQERSQADKAETFGATITDALETLQKHGYKGDFRVESVDAVECLQCHKMSPPEKIRLKEMCRVEGVSDPADEELVAGLVCPKCNANGTLILTYGPSAPPEDGSILKRLDDQRPELR